LLGTGGTVDTEFDVVSYLRDKGYEGKATKGGQEMLYPCFFGCAEPNYSTKRKLSVHVEDGFYQCWVCEAKGGTFLLQQHFGDDPAPRIDDSAWNSRLILDEATEVAAQMLTGNDELLLYLMEERGLDPETIVERRLGYIGGRWSLVQNLPTRRPLEDLIRAGLVRTDEERRGQDWFYQHLLIPYINRGHTIHMRGRLWGSSKGARYLSGNDQPSRLYNADSLRDAEEVIVCEGELDTIVVAQALAKSNSNRLKKMAVVGLPGLQAIPEEFERAMSEMKMVFIGFDSDEPGRKAAVKMKEQLGAKARILELPEDDEHGCDWSDYLLPAPLERDELWRAMHPHAGHDWANISALMSQASGRRIVSVAEAGASWRTSRKDLDFILTGYRQLDATIAPGLLPGQVMIPLANTGTGKTIWLCNLAYNMRRHPLLYVSLEMTSEEIYERLRRIYHFWHPHASDWEVDAGLSGIFICDENRLKENDLGALAAEYEMEVGVKPRVVFVDYLGYYARGFGGNSSYEKVGNAVMQLKAEAKAGRYTIIAPSQVNRGAKHGKPLEMDDARDAGQIEETADFLLSLYRPDLALQTEDPDSNVRVQQNGKLFADLMKSRHGGVGQKFAFQMDLAHLAIVDANARAAKRAQEHNFLVWRGYTYEDVRAQQLGPQYEDVPLEGA
jgi:5S rRNA maturation endonuclease (ribonuclease M5)